MLRLCFVLVLIGAVGCGDSGYVDDDDGDGSGAGSTGPGGGGPPIDTGCTGDPTIHEGEGTYYDFADGSGNCGFPATPNDLMVAAMNHVDYAGSAVCGACVNITGPNGQVKVRIVDQCPECPEGDIDLSPEAFEHIADLSAGRVPISWTYTACDVGGPIVYHFKDGSNPYWTAIQIRNHTYPVKTLEAADGSGNFTAIQRLDYNYFVADGGLGNGPYRLRVTDVNDHVLEDQGIELKDDGDSLGSAQFPVCAGQQ
jgi:expansin (peptidoglycan-binding protein)